MRGLSSSTQNTQEKNKRGPPTCGKCGRKGLNRKSCQDEINNDFIGVGCSINEDELNVNNGCDYATVNMVSLIFFIYYREYSVVYNFVTG